jgi:predicted transcriptional regulator
MPTLKVTVGNSDHLDQRTRSRIKAAQEGEDLDDAQPVLNFDSYAELSHLLSPKNLELLEAISEHEPASIREAAELVDRDYKQVHRNLSELADIGVIEFQGGGPGEAKNRCWPTTVSKSTFHSPGRTGTLVLLHRRLSL